MRTSSPAFDQTQNTVSPRVLPSRARGFFHQRGGRSALPQRQWCTLAFPTGLSCTGAHWQMGHSRCDETIVSVGPPLDPPFGIGNPRDNHVFDRYQPSLNGIPHHASATQL